MENTVEDKIVTNTSQEDLAQKPKEQKKPNVAPKPKNPSAAPNNVKVQEGISVSIKQKKKVSVPKAPVAPKAPSSNKATDAPKQKPGSSKKALREYWKNHKNPDGSRIFPKGVEYSIILTIHTTQAFALVVGGNVHESAIEKFENLSNNDIQNIPKDGHKKTKFSLNIFKFARSSNVIMKAYLEGNPFATKILCEFESGYENLMKELNNVNALFDDIINQHKDIYGITIEPSETKNTEQVPLHFRSQYANQAAKYIGAYDMFMRKALAVRRAQALSYQEWRNQIAVLNSNYRFLIRNFFGFEKFLDISLDRYNNHFVEADELVAQAVKKIGVLEDCYLDDSKHPKYLIAEMNQDKYEKIKEDAEQEYKKTNTGDDK